MSNFKVGDVLKFNYDSSSGYRERVVLVEDIVNDDCILTTDIEINSPRNFKVSKMENVKVFNNFEIKSREDVAKAVLSGNFVNKFDGYALSSLLAQSDEDDVVSVEYFEDSDSILILKQNKSVESICLDVADNFAEVVFINNEKNELKLRFDGSQLTATIDGIKYDGRLNGKALASLLTQHFS